jgi:hypothetical protein
VQRPFNGKFGASSKFIGFCIYFCSKTNTWISLMVFNGEWLMLRNDAADALKQT